ncbi:MAG: sigma-54-dependent Fis family transcriptional regulator [Alphaproteobacteria bacterium CG_4_10_14_0_2_um_filter_63_37]|nr:MAG: hypothetical protein AUJ55_07565 [Proteobacteria bacterium CG1_02_64_396]PJA24465.1 MAG: sigma-54-dependent Fis family transcriptional regulator [Alphaproteobacteria bacterium CG_4_10_14_0_2_um_filter_63_37]
MSHDPLRTLAEQWPRTLATQIALLTKADPSPPDTAWEYTLGGAWRLIGNRELPAAWGKGLADLLRHGASVPVLSDRLLEFQKIINLLHSLPSTMSEARSEEGLLTRLGEAWRQVTDFEEIFLFVSKRALTQEDEALHPVTGGHPAIVPGQGLLGQLLNESEAKVIDDPMREPRRLPGEAIGGSLLFLPITLDNRTIGAITLTRHQRFLATDRVIASTLAPLVALALTSIRRASSSIREGARFGAMLGQSSSMRRLFGEATIAAEDPDVSVLITGETGTGKELLAQALHDLSPRRSRPFVAINCAAIPHALLESELFGHERGAFTGADRSRIGRIVEADGGTLFLDEIGDMPSELQAKLLRVLETREVERVGGGKTKVDIRVIAATHQSLTQRVQEGLFRHDLLFRLNTFPLRLPPLRERREDIPLLAQGFAEQCRHRRNWSGAAEISSRALTQLIAHPWPGNVRELRNVMERATIRSQGEVIDSEHLWDPGSEPVVEVVGGPAAGGTAPATKGDGAVWQLTLPWGDATLNEVERRLLGDVLRHCRGNKAEAARMLGVDRSTFRYRLKRAGIHD